MVVGMGLVVHMCIGVEVPMKLPVAPESSMVVLVGSGKGGSWWQLVELIVVMLFVLANALPRSHFFGSFLGLPPMVFCFDDQGGGDYNFGNFCLGLKVQLWDQQ